MNVLLAGLTQSVASTVRTVLEGAGYSVVEADFMTDVPAIARRDDVDLILLGVPAGVRDMSASVRATRGAWASTPLLIVAASSTYAMQAALDAGADDVMPLAASRSEILARCGALAQPSHRIGLRLRLGALALDLETREASAGGRGIDLTRREFAVLEILATQRNLTVGMDTIIAGLRARDGDEPDPRVIDVLVCRVRRALDSAGAPELISTVPGVGYRLHDPALAGVVPASLFLAVASAMPAQAPS